MAIAFESASEITLLFWPTRTFAFTCSSNSNRILFLAIETADGGDFAAGNKAGEISSCTYNGVALTELEHRDYGNQRHVKLFMLVNPASGSNTISVTTALSAGYAIVTAAEYSEAAQADQPDAAEQNGATGTSVSVATTTIIDNSWICSYLSTYGSGDGTLTPNGDTTKRSSDGRVSFNDHATAVSPPASITLGGTIPVSQAWVMLSASFSPAAAAGGSKNPFGRTGARNRPVGRTGFRRDQDLTFTQRASKIFAPVRGIWIPA